MTKIIGLSGKKQSGKSTTVKALYAVSLVDQDIHARVDDKGQLVVMAGVGEKGKETFEETILNTDDPLRNVQEFLAEVVWPTVKEYSLAYPLKMFCVYVLGLDREQCFGTDDQKNSLTKYRWENMPVSREMAEDDKEFKEFCNTKHGQMTAREILQYFGTNICRKMNSLVWSETLERRIRMDEPNMAVVSDIRFPDEVDAVHNMGGKVIRYLRAPFAGKDEHHSETALDDYDNFDAVVDNKDMTIAEQIENVHKILLDWKYVE